MIGRSLAAQSQVPMKLAHENGSHIPEGTFLGRKVDKRLTYISREGTYNFKLSVML